MQELQSLLAKRRITDLVKFDHMKNRVRCYAHIINICSSHIIASFSSASELYLSPHKVPLDPDYAPPDDPDDDKGSSHSDDKDEEYEFKLPRCYSN